MRRSICPSFLHFGRNDRLTIPWMAKSLWRTTQDDKPNVPHATHPLWITIEELIVMTLVLPQDPIGIGSCSFSAP